METAIRVAYLGPEGTFTEEATRKHFGGDISPLLCASIDDVFRRVEAGAATHGVVPVEWGGDVPHPSPRRQVFCFLAGEFEVTAVMGATALLGLEMCSCWRTLLARDTQRVYLAPKRDCASPSVSRTDELVRS